MQYVTIAPPPQICPLRGEGESGPHLIGFLVLPYTHHTPTERHLDRVCRFSTVQARYQRTERDDGNRPVRTSRSVYATRATLQPNSIEPWAVK